MIELNKVIFVCQ